MATKLQDNSVSRETNHVISGRPLIVTLSPGGITLHTKGTQRKLKIDYATLFVRLCDEERRGGQSEITIPARRGRR